MEVEVAIGGVVASQMTRELVQRVNAIPGAEALPIHSIHRPGNKAAAGELIGAVLRLAAEKAVGPLVDLLSHFLTRDRKARVKLKLPNGTELEIESSNMEVDLARLRTVLTDLLRP